MMWSGARVRGLSRCLDLDKKGKNSKECFMSDNCMYVCKYLIDIFMIFDLYYISCKYVKLMNRMVLGNKQNNTITRV